MSVYPSSALSEVCNISMGQAPNGTSYNTAERGYPLIAGAGDFGDLAPMPTKYTDAPTKLSQPGDIVLCIRATIGDRNWSDKEYCLGRGVAGLRAKKVALSQAYLWHWLDHAAPVLSAKGRGATFLQVSKADIASLQIPLPPLAEQKRIAGILDAADAVRAKRREALAELDTLIQSTFLDMFGDSAANRMGWETATIGEMTTCLDRLRQPVKVADRVNGDIPYYGANGQQGWINEALFDEPLVLVAEDGGHFGDPARGVAYRIDGPSWVNNHAHVLRPAETTDVEYLHRALRHYDFGPYISGSTRAKLNQTQLNKAWLPFPPLDLQHRFAAIIESVENQRASQRAHLAELDTLFASLQSRAFRGDL